METSAANATGAATTASSNLAKLLNSPSQAKVQSSISAFRSYCELEDGSKMLISSREETPQFSEEKTFKQAFQMMDTDPSFKNMVEEVSSDEAVWKAFLNVVAVKDYLQSCSESLKTGANSRAKGGNKWETPEYNPFRCVQYPPERNEEKDSEAGVWKKIVSFFSRVWKTIWSAIKIAVLEHISNEEKQTGVEWAFALTLVVRLGIELMKLLFPLKV